MWEPSSDPFTVEVRDPEKKKKFKGMKSFTAYRVIPSVRRYRYSWGAFSVVVCVPSIAWIICATQSMAIVNSDGCGLNEIHSVV